MKNKIIRGVLIALCSVLSLLLILSCVLSGFFINSFFGNPISKALARRGAKNWLVTEYKDTDYVLDDVKYGFKEGCYYAYAESPSSPDSSFTIYLSMSGELIYDDFDSRVTGRQNTARRIDSEYRAAVEKIIYSEAFPYNFDIGYGTLLFDREISLAGFPVGTLDVRALVLDKQYDTNELGAAAGEITLYIQGESVTVERLAEITLDIKRLFDEGGVAFNSINIVLESGNERVEVMSMLYTDIYEDGILERVSASNDAAKKYYEELDKLK